ncbi:MAG: NmrA/HSCARG family protein [Alphaproteobacteria bacterium]
MSDKLRVLVTGATGQQGGAVARVLLRDGHQVVALTRKPGSDAARALAGAGATVAAGDFNDLGSLKAAASGTDADYLMSTPFEAGTDAEAEHGRQGVDALKAANVGHVVYSSVGSADRDTGVPHFDSKYEVEKYLAQSGVPYTISAPVYFMDNLFSPWIPSPLTGEFSMAMPADRKLQQIAVSDIGEFGARLIERRERVFGKRYDIAGDELTNAEMVAIVSRISDVKIAYNELSVDMIRTQNEDLAKMYGFFNNVGYAADIAGLRQEFPEVKWQSFESWAKSLDWQALSAQANAA